MIARYTQDRHTQMSKHAADVLVPGRVILNEIAGDEDNIRWPRRRALRVGKRGLERGQCCYPAQGFRFAPVQVRIGELNEAQTSHD